MLTQFGIFARKLRLDYDELLKDMAVKLDVSPSFLSAVENGKKGVPSGWVEKISEDYNLDNEKQVELRNAVLSTQKTLDVNIENLNQEKKILAFSFARKIDDFDDDTVEKLKRIFDMGDSE